MPTGRDGGDASAGSAWWPWLKRGLTLAFFAAVATLLVRFGSEVEWSAVWRTARENPPATLLLAALLAVVSHALVASFDLIGRHVTGHGLPVPRVLSVAWIAYAFNLNLGALVGGAGFRWRLYSRLGLGNAAIAQVYGLSVVTNWSGYLVLIGLSWLLWPVPLPADWPIGRQMLTVLGAVLPLVAIAYAVGCARARKRRWEWRGHGLDLPSGRVAAVQLALSSVNWLVMAAVIYILLGRQVDYPVVLGVLLLAAVAGAITHVPAGLGVLEAVFVTLLGSDLPKSEILAAMLTYRALYYLLPLSCTLVLYTITELRLRHRDTAQDPASG